MSVGEFGVKTTITNGTMSEEEIKEYIKFGQEQYPSKIISEMHIRIDGEFVDLEYKFIKTPQFERIRRITGYLTGTTSRWNNAKKTEESQRVKHGTSDEYK